MLTTWNGSWLDTVNTHGNNSTSLNTNLPYGWLIKQQSKAFPTQTPSNSISERETNMNIINQKDEQRKRIHKAANTAAEYQAAWKDFYAKPSHKMAREVITKGEATLDQQNTTGLSMLNANSVRHRILTVQDWLEQTPEPAAPQKAIEKLYKRNPDGSLVCGLSSKCLLTSRPLQWRR